MVAREALRQNDASCVSKQLQNQKLFARGFPFNTSEEEIIQLFSQFGEVNRVLMCYHKSTKFRGFAYVVMESRKGYCGAIRVSDQDKGLKFRKCCRVFVSGSKSKEEMKKARGGHFKSSQSHTKSHIGKKRSNLDDAKCREQDANPRNLEWRRGFNPDEDVERYLREEEREQILKNQQNHQNIGSRNRNLELYPSEYNHPPTDQRTRDRASRRQSRLNKVPMLIKGPSFSFSEEQIQPQIQGSNRNLAPPHYSNIHTHQDRRSQMKTKKKRTHSSKIPGFILSTSLPDYPPQLQFKSYRRSNLTMVQSLFRELGIISKSPSQRLQNFEILGENAHESEITFLRFNIRGEEFEAVPPENYRIISGREVTRNN